VITAVAVLCAYSDLLASASSPRHALVIGNGNYAGAQKLTNPGRDANAMAKVLKQLGFDVTLLLDLDLRQMNQAVSEFARELKGRENAAVVYYAGHAVEVGGVNYLLPVSSQINSAADLKYEAMNVQRVLDNLQNSRDGLNILMIDACRNNPFRAFRSLDNKRGVARMNAPLGTFISSATASGDFAEDGFGKNSPYTTAVIKHITTPGLTLEQVFKQVRIDVVENTGGKQVPWESSSTTA